uniref:protein-tyrosine-phosphatase n=1 Tax=Globodera pallida TaxID=36090 RepID=A0A183C6C7_GLOPA
MRKNSIKLEDRTVLSRHLANNNEQSNRIAAGTLTGKGTDWLSITYPMGNLASNLRRSMPSMNDSSDGPPGAASEKLIQRGGTTVRHGSFSREEGVKCQNQNQKQQQQQQQQQQENAMATTSAETSHGRHVSAHSLSLSDSMIFNEAASVTSQSLAEFAAGGDRSGGMPVVDTRHIQVFLKNRQDSMTMIGSQLSDTLSAGKASVISAPPQASQRKSAFDQKFIVQEAFPPSSSSSFAHVPRHSSSSHKVFRTSDTRSSIVVSSSVSSSFDSTKEEWFISNFEHASPSQSVMVLPRPASLQYDDYDEGAKTPVPPPPPPPTLSPIPPLSLSAWHSVSDLTPSARTVVATAATNNDGSRRGSTMSGENASGGGKVSSPPSPLPQRPQSQAGHRKSKYLGELVWQVDETVFCGGIESVQNQNLLCRLNIEYIVDLSGQEDDPLLSNSRPRTECPCLCPRRTAHSRMTMSMKLKDDSSQQMLSRETRPSTAESKAQLLDREQIVRYFETLIDLIRKARISQKKVLIHSLKGRNRAPAFVAAYLMHCNRITRVQAINRITKLMRSTRPGLCISDSLQRALMRWQFILGIRAESSRLDSQSLNKMFAVKRNAWN